MDLSLLRSLFPYSVWDCWWLAPVALLLDLRLGDHGAPITDPDMMLMEIKFPGVCPLWLSRLLSREKVFPTSFSKYGACYRNHILPNIQKEGRTCA